MSGNAIYFDHNASTPTDPRVLQKILEVTEHIYANASSTEHAAGHAASNIVETARDLVAQTIGCRSKEIIFTGGSTESNNLAILGSFPALEKLDRTHLVTSKIEHPSVTACFERLAARGANVTWLGVDENGVIHLDELEEAVTEKTGLVSVMAANNETGVLQPIKEIGAICELNGALFHSDFSQATAYLHLDLAHSSIHMASFSGHKAYGPKGVGALYRSMRKPRVALEPILLGGGQENGLRPGTLNTPGISGLGEAFKIVSERRQQDAKHTALLRDQLQETLMQIDGVVINGADALRLPNTLSLSISGIEPLALMHALKDELTFSASSACSTNEVKTSHVLTAMFGDGARAREAFRLGIGRGTDEAAIAKASQVISIAVSNLRNGLMKGI